MINEIITENSIWSTNSDCIEFFTQQHGWIPPPTYAHIQNWNQRQGKSWGHRWRKRKSARPPRWSDELLQWSPVTRTNHPNHHRENLDQCHLVHRWLKHLMSEMVQAMLHLWKSQQRNDKKERACGGHLLIFFLESRLINAPKSRKDIESSCSLRKSAQKDYILLLRRTNNGIGELQIKEVTWGEQPRRVQIPWVWERFMQWSLTSPGRWSECRCKLSEPVVAIEVKLYKCNLKHLVPQGGPVSIPEEGRPLMRKQTFFLGFLTRIQWASDPSEQGDKP